MVLKTKEIQRKSEEGNRHGPGLAACGATGAWDRMLRVGPRALATVELLELVLGPRVGRADHDLAPRLLLDWGSIQALVRERAPALLRVPGMGPARTSRLLAALELGRRAVQDPLRPGREVRGPRDVAPALRVELGGRQRERFVALYLDARHRLLDQVTVAVGSLDASLVHPREVFRPAVAVGAVALLVAHNHPSGCPRPSRDDLELTARLDRCGRLMGIELLDHLVVGAREVLSIRELGWPREGIP
jgi:DNA repair protein RadC